MNDLTRWVAESDPVVVDEADFRVCYYCKEWMADKDNHAPGCRYVLAREDVKRCKPCPTCGDTMEPFFDRAIECRNCGHSEFEEAKDE